MSNTNELLNIPKNITSMSIDDLINDPRADVVKRGNKTSMRWINDNGDVLTVGYSKHGGLTEGSISRIDGRNQKSDFEEEIRELKKSGMLQKDIAFKLGMSESYVSKILRQK